MLKRYYLILVVSFFSYKIIIDVMTAYTRIKIMRQKI